MAVKRNVSATGLDGATWSADVDGSLNAAFSLSGGRLLSVAGTNTITATLLHPTGFASYPDGFKCTLIPVATNTAAVTLNIASVGAISVRDGSGVALAAGALVVGRAQPLIYDATAGYFRFDGTAKPDTTVVTAAVLSKLSVHLANGSFVTPKTGWYRIWCVGGGGSGAYTTSVNFEESGGAAAGLCMKLVYLASGITLTIVVGAGGAAPAANSNGNSGNASSVTGTGVSMTANGGGGGFRGATGSAAATGGTATGGDVNVTGQNSPAMSNGGQYSAGGTIGLLTQHAQQANNTTTATDFWATVAPASALGPFSAGLAIKGGDSAGLAPSLGCGSAGSYLGSPTVRAGGAGFVVIEYEA